MPRYHSKSVRCFYSIQQCFGNTITPHLLKEIAPALLQHGIKPASGWVQTYFRTAAVNLVMLIQYCFVIDSVLCFGLGLVCWSCTPRIFVSRFHSALVRFTFGISVQGSFSTVRVLIVCGGSVLV